MREFFKVIGKDKITSIGFSASALLILVIFMLILLFYRSLPPFVPIFNQLPWGEERLGKTITIFIPPLTSLIIFILNLFISTLVYERIPLVSRMLAGTSLLITVLTFLFVIKTIILIL